MNESANGLPLGEPHLFEGERALFDSTFAVSVVTSNLGSVGPHWLRCGQGLAK